MLSKAISWFVEGFRLFKLGWSVFLLQTLFLFITIAVSYLMKIFVLSIFLYIIQILLTAGMFISFYNLKNSRKITFDNLFDGFSYNLSGLVMLSIIFLLSSLVVSYLLVQFVNVNDIISNYKQIAIKNYTPIFLIAILDAIINFILTLSMPFVAIKKLNVFESIRKSVVICLKHLISIVILLFIFFVLGVFATFSIIGWLILFPVGIGSIFAIFHENYDI